MILRPLRSIETEKMENETAHQAMQELLEPNREDESEGMNRVLAILAQVSLAVLIIFIMIAILFSSEFKDKAAFYRQRLETLENTTQGKALLEIQRQKLLLAMERTNQHYRLNLGHLTLYRTDDQKRRRVHTENIVTGRQIRSDFKKACAFAKEELDDFNSFRQTYKSKILTSSGIAPAGMKVTEALLDEKNRAWLNDKVRETTRLLYEDTIQLQEDAKEGLAKYYQEHLSEVEALQRTARELSSAPTKEAIDRLMVEVTNFVQNELSRQQVELLVPRDETSEKTMKPET